MTPILATRGQCELRYYTPACQLDFPSLGRFSEDCWSQDYRDTVRRVYDESYFRWLLQGDDWVGLVAQDAEGAPAATVFSLFRNLRISGESVAAAYATQLTVSPAYRRYGFALWLTDWNRRIVFERCDREALFGMMHDGHAAMRGLTRLPDASPWDSVALSQGVMWTKRAYTSNATTASGRHWDKVRQLTSGDLEMFDELIGQCTLPTFGVEESFGRMYLDERSARSGTIWCSSAAGARCAVSFSIQSMRVGREEFGSIGQIHCVHIRHCDSADLTEALHETVRVLSSRGCIAACILNQGHLNAAILARAGFVPSEDRLTLVLRARSEVVQQTRDKGPVLLVDML